MLARHVAGTGQTPARLGVLFSCFFFFYNFIYLLLAVPGLHRCPGFPLVAESRGSSLVWARRLPVVAASLAADHKLSTCGAGFSYSSACGIFLDQGSNLRLLHRQADSSPRSHQGSPKF